MENTNEFIVPETITKPRKKKEKIEPKQILEERPRLTRTNRTIPCAYCSTEKILNPDQYQSMFDYWGNEEKIAREFMCKDCEVSMKENPIKFWAKHGELLPTLTRKVRAAFEVFNSSARGNNEIVTLQNMINSFLGEVFIDPRLAEYGTEPAARGFLVKTLKLKTLPFIGNITIQPYESSNNRFKLE